MAPGSRIILIRHAQAEHNVDLDYSIPDAPLTALGRKQAARLSSQVAGVQEEVDLVVSSPLQRTLQTTLLGWRAAVQRLGIGKLVCLPQAQECNAFPCDIGSARSVLEKNPEFAGIDFSPLPSDWTSKKGFWAADDTALQNRAKAVRQFLRDRPESTIVLVAHGDILRRITSDAHGPSEHLWLNAEARVFTFDPKTVHGVDCSLKAEGEAAVAGGYGPTSSEADLL